MLDHRRKGRGQHRFEPQRLGHTRLQIVADDDGPADAAEGGDRAHMALDSVRQILAGACKGEGQIGSARDRDRDLGAIEVPVTGSITGTAARDSRSASPHSPHADCGTSRSSGARKRRMPADPGVAVAIGIRRRDTPAINSVSVTSFRFSCRGMSAKSGSLKSRGGGPARPTADTQASRRAAAASPTTQLPPPILSSRWSSAVPTLRVKKEPSRGSGKTARMSPTVIRLACFRLGMPLSTSSWPDSQKGSREPQCLNESFVVSAFRRPARRVETAREPICFATQVQRERGKRGEAVETKSGIFLAYSRRPARQCKSLTSRVFRLCLERTCCGKRRPDRLQQVLQNKFTDSLQPEIADIDTFITRSEVTHR